MVNSALYTIAELKLIGALLSELKQIFTTETLITSWQFTGQKLKREGLIDSGITFIYLVILFNNKFSINRSYGLNNENKEVTYYNIFNNGEFFQTILSIKNIYDDCGCMFDPQSITIPTWLIPNWIPVQGVGSSNEQDPTDYENVKLEEIFG